MSELSDGCFFAKPSTAVRIRSKANEGGAMNSVLFVPYDRFSCAAATRSAE